MRRFILATAAGAALLAGAGAASAQNFQGDGPDYYAYRGAPAAPTWNNSDVGLSTGQTYWQQDQARTGSPANTEAFHAQELMPQSPPGGGY